MKNIVACSFLLIITSSMQAEQELEHEDLLDDASIILVIDEDLDKREESCDNDIQNEESLEILESSCRDCQDNHEAREIEDLMIEDLLLAHENGQEDLVNESFHEDDNEQNQDIVTFLEIPIEEIDEHVVYPQEIINQDEVISNNLFVQDNVDLPIYFVDVIVDDLGENSNNQEVCQQESEMIIDSVENDLMNKVQSSEKEEMPVEQEIIVTDEEINPVPHDLINSVKKAAKKKKKLEERLRKEKLKNQKKSKKNKDSVSA